MDPKIRYALEREVDEIIKNPKKAIEILEDIGVEPTEEHALAFIAGFLTAVVASFYEKEMPAEDRKEMIELIRRRITEIRLAFMR